MLDTIPLLEKTAFPSVTRSKLDILQVNLGYLCNLSCTHCHVNAGPSRTELMDEETVSSVIQFLENSSVKILDLTGGAPEMNPHFRYLVNAARTMGIDVIDRCNLTILLEPGFETLAEFLAQHQVTITASLPCYLEENVSQQRGKGVYEESITVLKTLNNLGYGKDSELKLNLVYNPIGTNLPPPQQQLEEDYKKYLKQEFEVSFNQLFTITNMPIKRFGSMLLSKGIFDQYMSLLKDNFSESNLETVMCRNLLSVDYQGYLFDCDFNQMMGLPIQNPLNKRTHLSEITAAAIEGTQVRVGDHCYGCTAGQGSSCGGALSD